jgi:hypothetical protein
MPFKFVMWKRFSGRSRRIFGLRSARGTQNSDADHDDYADRNPRGGDAHQVSRDCQPDDQDDETDEVRTE